MREKRLKRPLSKIDVNHLDLIVRCGRDLPNSANPASTPRCEGGFTSYVGSKPVFFLNDTYRIERQNHIKQLVEDDEKKYGSEYPRQLQDGNTTGNTT